MKTPARVRRAIQELTAGSLCVRMDVKMAAAALVPTDVHASTGLPGHNAKETTGQDLASHRSTTKCARVS